MFSGGGDCAFFLPLEYRVPLSDWITVGSTPDIYHLVELKDTYHRYLVPLATEKTVRIPAIDRGSLTVEVWSTRPELRRRVGREWTQEHYQAHRRERTNQFVDEQIRVLSRGMSAGGYEHLVLAGDPRAAALLRKVLPRRLEARVIDVLCAFRSDYANDVVAATLFAFIEQEKRESLAVVEKLSKQTSTHGSAVAKTRATIQALEQWRVDVLVLAKAYAPDPGWACFACGTREMEAPAPSVYPRCQANQVRALRIRAEMVRLAEQQGVGVEIVNGSDDLMLFGGVGCLLRYRDWEERPFRQQEQQHRRFH